MCRVNITGGECPQEEINAYIARGQQLYGREPDAIDVRLDGEYVELAYHYQNQPFDRIRRITGYLVGTLDRFNNAKRAEERDRVKHSITLQYRFSPHFCLPVRARWCMIVKGLYPSNPR